MLNILFVYFVATCASASAPEGSSMLDPIPLYDSPVFTLQGQAPPALVDLALEDTFRNLVSSLSQAGSGSPILLTYFEKLKTLYQTKARFVGHAPELLAEPQFVDLEVFRLSNLPELKMFLQHLATVLAPAIVASQNSIFWLKQGEVSFASLSSKKLSRHMMNQDELEAYLKEHIADLWSAISLNASGYLKDGCLYDVDGEKSETAKCYNALWKDISDPLGLVRERQLIIEAFSKIADPQYRMPEDKLSSIVMLRVAELNGAFLDAVYTRTERLLPYICVIYTAMKKGVEALNARLSEHNAVCKLLGLENACFDSKVPTHFKLFSIEEMKKESPKMPFIDVMRSIENPTEWECCIAAQVVDTFDPAEKAACEKVWDLSEAENMIAGIKEEEYFDIH